LVGVIPEPLEKSQEDPPFSGSNPSDLMPSAEILLGGSIDCGSGTPCNANGAKQLRDFIYAGSVVVREKMKYSDVFGDQIQITCDITGDPKEQKLKIINSSITGYCTY
jgi:hypothetical protein